MNKPLVFGQFTLEHYDKMKDGLLLYNSGHYWLCHEYLEDLWMDYIGDNARYVYWVIIQVATSLYHLEDNNMNGASGMINKAKRKIDYIEKSYVESYVLENELNWTLFKSLIVSIPQTPEAKDFDELKKFKFKL